MPILLGFSFLALLFLQIYGESDRCLQPLDPGPCQYFQTKWFWDPKFERCNEFHYGGCLGNQNRFNTKQECVKQCIFKEHNPVAIPDLCLLEPDAGHCPDDRNGQWWYHFNAVNGVCEQFFYYGCGGNHNKFYSLYQCRKVCGERLSPQIACDQCDVRTSLCKQNSKYNYTCECRPGFQKNDHGECEDADECRQSQHNCGENSLCANTIGSFSCECKEGYVGDGRKCSFVGLGTSTDDCSQCSENAACKNGICQCKLGFRGDGFNCTDVNECLRFPNPCDSNAECKNVEGSFICECLSGYAGNGYNCTKATKSCLDKFDREYQETCGAENWREHYFLDPITKRCSLFWYDGCPGTSMNIFSSLKTCEDMCERSQVLARSEICWDKFDPNFKNQCLAGEWQQRYYFDHASLTCRLFWYDGCQGNSRNTFDDLLTCQWLCEEQPRYSSKACLQQFDEHYRDECNGGRWRQQYYFDKNKKRCTSFWYDGCKGESENIFQDEITCVKQCENDAKKAESEENPNHMQNYSEERNDEESAEAESYESEFKIDSARRRQDYDDIKAGKKVPSTTTKKPRKENKHRHKQKLNPTRKLEQPNNASKNGSSKSKTPKNFCELSNPCENNGTCIFDSSKNQYYCKCARGFTNDNCTERIDSDPCASNPCQNGATCAAKATSAKTLYECICPQGFGGINCETRPCDENPCKNNGTCRTTRSLPAFFCECPVEWGGQHCELEVPQTTPLKYGKNVNMVSSGQADWIEELKRRQIKPKTELPSIKTAKDFNRTVILNDEPVDSYGSISISDYLKNNTSASGEGTYDLENIAKAGQTGEEFSLVHERHPQNSASFLPAVFSIIFLSFLLMLQF